MSDKKTLRTEAGERIDQPDFQHAAEQAELFDGVNNAAVLVERESYIIDGFIPTGILSSATITITRDGNSRPGEAVLALRGVSGLSYGHVVAGGDATRALDVSGLADGNYRLYISFEWRDADSGNRTFWNPDAGSGGPIEIVDNIPTRREANWTTTIALDGVNPGSEWLQIGRFSITSGLISGSNLVDTRPLFYEGYVNDPDFLGIGVTSYDPEVDAFGFFNARDGDRSTHGFHNLRRTIRALQSQIRDLHRAVSSNAGTERWWESVVPDFLLARDGSRTVTGSLLPDIPGASGLGSIVAYFSGVFGVLARFDIIQPLLNTDLVLLVNAGDTIELEGGDVLLDVDKIGFDPSSPNAPTPVTDTAPTLYRNTIPVAWAFAESDGAGGIAVDRAVGCTVSVSGSNFLVTFDAAITFATPNDYAVTTNSTIGITYGLTSRSFTSFELAAIDTSGSPVDVSTTATEVNLVVFGTRS